MTGLIVKVWSILLLLPMIPVVLLYTFFAGQNYFELKDAARGMVAVGPIAAYVTLVLIGWRIYMKVSKTFSSSEPALNDLPGKWYFTARSGHGTTREGNCMIENVLGHLVISGDFRENGEHVGNWTSEMTHLKGNNLYMVYTLEELKAGKIERVDGLCRLSFGTLPVSRMSGTWAVVGQEEMVGTVSYEKIT